MVHDGAMPDAGPGSPGRAGEDGAVFEALDQAWPLYERYVELSAINDVTARQPEWTAQSVAAPLDFVILPQ